MREALNSVILYNFLCYFHQYVFISIVTGGKPVSSDPTKRLRNLKKKLRDIEKLERQIANGDIKNPEPEQLEKVKRKEEVAQQVEELELEVDDEN